MSSSVIWVASSVQNSSNAFNRADYCTALGERGLPIKTKDLSDFGKALRRRLMAFGLKRDSLRSKNVSLVSSGITPTIFRTSS